MIAMIVARPPEEVTTEAMIALRLVMTPTNVLDMRNAVGMPTEVMIADTAAALEVTPIEEVTPIDAQRTRNAVTTVHRPDTKDTRRRTIALAHLIKCGAQRLTISE